MEHDNDMFIFFEKGDVMILQIAQKGLVTSGFESRLQKAAPSPDRVVFLIWMMKHHGCRP